MNDSSRQSQALNEAVLWSEYYRVGTMYAFQLFHKQQFEQAFAEFNEFLTDPAEIISLFGPLSANTWLTNSYNDLNTFAKQHIHFSVPNDFVGVTFKNALDELQHYLTDLRRVFQTVFRRAPDAWLEVIKKQSFFFFFFSIYLLCLGSISCSKLSYIKTCS
jgi:hypothetical protein